MESRSGNKQGRQFSFPMIIAMKGHLSDKKSEIATKLADFLQNPLINEADIIETIQDSISFSSTDDDLPFNIALKISSTQLNLKFNVVINTILSEPTHFDQLVQLAKSKSARLLIIECETQSNNDVLDDSYDNGNVPKLNIDTTKPFVLEEFVPKLLHAAKFPQGDDLSIKLSQNNDDIMTTRPRIDGHIHEFSFTKESKSDFEKLNCNRCKKVISSSIYRCVVCDEFVLHKSCAESPSQLTQGHRKNRPMPENTYPKMLKCNLCKDFLYSCNDCLLQTHIECGFLPTILEYKKHTHPLNFVIMPLWINYKYLCSACDKLGESISYKCYHCNLDFHINCLVPYNEMLRLFSDHVPIVNPELIESQTEGMDKSILYINWCKSRYSN